MPVLCWHYTPSLWPWSLWTLSCTVSMTTTQGRLLVTCVGGFACTEWELHNRLKREGERGSLWQCSACWNENQLYESCNGAITEHVADDGEVAVFLFIQTDISHINTLHNCSGSHYSSNPECLSCGTQLACERSKKKNRNAVDMFPSSWWRHHGILLQTLSSLSFFLWEKILPSHVERPPLAETGKASHCIADLPCCSHLFCLPTQLRCRLVICRGLIHKNLTGLQLYNMPA